MLHAREDYNQRIQDSANVIPDDEPVVLIRAQDELGVQAIEFYAYLCNRYQAHDVADRMLKHSQLMRKWPKKKIPDLPNGV